MSRNSYKDFKSLGYKYIFYFICKHIHIIQQIYNSKSSAMSYPQKYVINMESDSIIFEWGIGLNPITLLIILKKEKSINEVINCLGNQAPYFGSKCYFLQKVIF